MAIPVKLQVFEGPLDLLLHLIDKNKIDIYDIPIVTITEQYLVYIKEIPKKDMNIMSEFLVMAATLLDIKCKMLLPKEINEEGEEEDPRAELVEKLLEYKMYQYMSYELKERQTNAGKTMYKPPTIPLEVADYKAPINYDELVGDLTISKLHTIFKHIIKRETDKIDTIRSQFGKIEKDEVNMEERMNYVETYLLKNKKISFKELIEKESSKINIVVTFLVILELMKVGKIRIEQVDLFEDIIIISNEE